VFTQSFISLLAPENYFAGEAFKRFAALSGGETRWQLTSHEAGWRVFETCSRYRDIYSTPSDTIFPRRVFKVYVLELARQPLSMNSAFKRSRSFLQEVGIILTQPQRVFHRLMDVGDSRMQWDTTFSRLSILDRVDKFTDTIELASGGKVFYRNNPSAQKASH
jgi:hypothetical protein